MLNGIHYAVLVAPTVVWASVITRRACDVFRNPIGTVSRTIAFSLFRVATPRGLEPLTSGVTGRRADQLHHEAMCRMQLLCKFAPENNLKIMRCGGAYGGRTRDLLRARQALSHLS